MTVCMPSPYSDQEMKQRRYVMSFVTQDDVRQMKDIEKHYKVAMEEVPLDIADIMESELGVHDMWAMEIQRFVRSDPREQ